MPTSARDVAGPQRRPFGLRLVAFASVALLSLLTATLAGAQVPRLLRDLNQANAGSAPSDKVEMGGYLYFSAFDVDHGRELWRTDGTPSGTTLVKDLVPSPSLARWLTLVPAADRLFVVTNLDGSTFSNLDPWQLWVSDGTPEGTERLLASDGSFRGAGFTAVGDRLFFFAGSAEAGWELRSSDGTAAGTITLADGFITLSRWRVALGDRLFFTADDGVHGDEPWVSDGTENGTQLLRDIRPGAESTWLSSGAQIGDRLYFDADDGVHGEELWTTDGTPAGTLMIKDILPGEASSHPWAFVEFGEQFVFTAQAGQGRTELWISDGTENGTRLVLEAPATSRIGALTIADDRFFFTRNFRELWTSDGSQAGTTMVRDFGSDTTPLNLTGVGGRLFFIAEDPELGLELWSSDGTEAGTKVVEEIGPGAESPFFFGKYAGRYMVRFAFDERLFFLANDGIHGHELWTSDGTAAGTYLVKNIKPGSLASEIRFFAALDGRLVFNADDGVHGEELWVTDGTDSGTTLVRDIDSKGTLGSNPGGYSDRGFAEFDGALYFSALDCSLACADRDEYYGVTSGELELWRSDGTAAGTFQLLDIAQGQSSRPGPLAAAEDALYFFAWHPEYGRELWASDGTRKGTGLVADLVPGPDDMRAHELTPVGDRVFFAGNTGELGWELFVSDGSTQGTGLVTELQPGYESSDPSFLHAFDDLLYFNAEDADHGKELWVSDGTESGTRMVKDIHPGRPSGYPENFRVSNGLLFFTARDGKHGDELWRTDGTRRGTKMVKDIAAGEQSSSIYPLATSKTRLFFSANDAVHGDELWVTDGTRKGTRLVKDIVVGEEGSDPIYAAVVGELVVFAVRTDKHGNELWASDGTEEGTRLVKDLWPGRFSSSPSGLQAFDDRVYFAANHADFGRELWLTDGTRKGTRMVADLSPGPANSYPRSLQNAGRHLFFTAQTLRTGTELWALSGGSSVGGLPGLLAMEDLDGLGGDELAILNRQLVVRDAASGVKLSDAEFAEGQEWQAIDFESTGDMNGNGASEIAILARERHRVEILVRDGLTGEALTKVQLSRKDPLDLECLPGIGSGPARAAVLTRRGLGERAAVSIVPLAASGGAVDYLLPRHFDAFDLEAVELPNAKDAGSAWALVVVGRAVKSGRVRLVTLDAETGQRLGDSTLNGELVPIDLEITHPSSKGAPHASVLVQRKGNGAARVITLDPLDGDVVKTLRLRKKRVPLVLKAAPGRKGSFGPNVSVLWTDKRGTAAGVTTRNAFTGKKLDPMIFEESHHPKDLALLRLPHLETTAAAVLAEAECANFALAVSLRDTVSAELLACYPVD